MTVPLTAGRDSGAGEMGRGVASHQQWNNAALWDEVPAYEKATWGPLHVLLMWVCQWQGRRECEDPRVAFSGQGGGRGGVMRRLAGPNGETFGSPAATKRGEALKVPPARVTLRTTSCGSHVGLSAARKGAGLLILVQSRTTGHAVTTAATAATMPSATVSTVIQKASRCCRASSDFSLASPRPSQPSAVGVFGHGQPPPDQQP